MRSKEEQLRSELLTAAFEDSVGVSSFVYRRRDGYWVARVDLPDGRRVYTHPARTMSGAFARLSEFAWSVRAITEPG